MELAANLSHHVPVTFISFRALYPRWCYPGGDLNDDSTFPSLDIRQMNVQRTLDWYNPLGWMLTALRIRSDVVHFQYWSLPLAPVYAVMSLVLRWRRVKVVVTIHNVRSHESGALYTFATKQLCRLADRCIVHVDCNAQTAITALGIHPANIRRISMGVMTYLNAQQVDRQTARARLHLPQTAPLVLCFGAIRPYKGIDVLLCAFRQLVHRVPDAILLIAGKPWINWEPYRRMIETYGLQQHVRTFLEYINTSDVSYFFHATDVIVLPYTHFDAQSAVGTAALAFAKPMVVSDVGALPELVKHARWRVPPGDSKALSSALADLLTNQDLRKQASHDAEAIASTMSWDRIAEQTVDLYRDASISQ